MEDDVGASSLGQVSTRSGPEVHGERAWRERHLGTALTDGAGCSCGGIVVCLLLSASVEDPTSTSL